MCVFMLLRRVEAMRMEKSQLPPNVDILLFPVWVRKPNKHRKETNNQK